MGQCPDRRSYPQLSTHYAPLSRHCFVADQQSSSHRPHPFPTRDMTDQPGSARFQALLESALQAYEKKAGVTLADSEDSLAIRLQCCHSIDDITTLLQAKTQAFDDFRQRDKIFKSINATVSILTPISALVSVADDAGLVRQEVLKVYLAFLILLQKLFPHTKAINSTIGILLDVCTVSSYVDILLTSRSTGGQWRDHELRHTHRDARVD